jgi:hypothetical protein
LGYFLLVLIDSNPVNGVENQRGELGAFSAALGAADFGGVHLGGQNDEQSCDRAKDAGRVQRDRVWLVREADGLVRAEEAALERLHEKVRHQKHERYLE